MPSRHCVAEVVALLIQHWPDALQVADNSGMLPLQMACFMKCDAKVVALLIEHWPDALRAVDNCGQSPLHSANVVVNVTLKLLCCVVDQALARCIVGLAIQQLWCHSNNSMPRVMVIA